MTYFASKIAQQINVMNAGLTLRSGLGIGVLVVGLMLTNEIMRQALFDSVSIATNIWKGKLTG